MASLVSYAVASFESGALKIVSTGQVKKQVKSEIDDQVGEQQIAITEKLEKFPKITDKLEARIQTVICGLKRLEESKCNSGDRSFLFLIDEPVVKLVNENSPLQLINELLKADYPKDKAPAMVKELYNLKYKLGTRIGTQAREKNNRFIAKCKSLLAGELGPKTMPWEKALSKAKDGAKKMRMSQVRNELEQLEQALQQEPIKE